MHPKSDCISKFTPHPDRRAKTAEGGGKPPSALTDPLPFFSNHMWEGGFEIPGDGGRNTPRYEMPVIGLNVPITNYVEGFDVE